jgi:hypothetical protein
MARPLGGNNLLQKPYIFLLKNKVFVRKNRNVKSQFHAVLIALKWASSALRLGTTGLRELP